MKNAPALPGVCCSDFRAVRIGIAGIGVGVSATLTGHIAVSGRGFHRDISRRLFAGRIVVSALGAMAWPRRSRRGVDLVGGVVEPTAEPAGISDASLGLTMACGR